MATSAERTADRAAHDVLRDAIRAAVLTLWDLRMGEEDADSHFAETRPEVERGVLVDYAVVAVFDSGDDTHTVDAVLRTDGLCASYRTLGLLTQGMHSLARS